MLRIGDGVSDAGSCSGDSVGCCCGREIATIVVNVGGKDDAKGLEEAAEACPRHRRQEFHEVMHADYSIIRSR